MIKNVITPEVNEHGKIMRRVCSFARRQGRLTARQRNALQVLWPKMGIDFTGQPILLDSVFGNKAPVILEIGFGMGASLVSMAEQNPAKNFLGIEVYAPGIGACLAAAKEAKLNNLRVIYHDVTEVLDKMLLDDSLNIVQIFFPDPWYKVKHNKRRIIQQPFAKLILHKLKLDGILHIATDWQSYAEHILNVINGISDYRNLSASGDYVQRPTLRPITKFEKRGQQLDHKIFDLMFKRIK